MKQLRIAAVSVAIGLAAMSVAAPGAIAEPRAQASVSISVSYAKKAMRKYIERKWTVNRGPYFSACSKLASNRVRCEVEFRAGVTWWCGRISVKAGSKYDYISARIPVC